MQSVRLLRRCSQLKLLPFEYYRDMTLLLCTFEVVVAFTIALQGFESDSQGKAGSIAIDCVFFGLITFVAVSIFHTSISLLMPWQSAATRCAPKNDASDDFIPEYTSLLHPLVNARTPPPLPPPLQRTPTTPSAICPCMHY